MFLAWWHKFVNGRSQRPTRNRRRSGRPDMVQFRPLVEELEERTVPSHVPGHEIVSAIPDGQSVVALLAKDLSNVYWAEDGSIGGFILKFNKGIGGGVGVLANTANIRDMTHNGADQFLYYVDGDSLFKVFKPTGARTLVTSDFIGCGGIFGDHPSFVTMGRGAYGSIYVTNFSGTDGTVYRVDKSNGAVNRLCNRSNPTDIATGPTEVHFIEPPRGRIIQATNFLTITDEVTGTGTGGNGPQTVVTDLHGGLFWLEGNGRVWQYVGGTFQNLALTGTGANGGGLAVDDTGGNVFFASGASLSFVPKGGSPTQARVLVPNAGSPVFIDVDATHVYWSGLDGRINRFPKPNAAPIFFPMPSLYPAPNNQAFQAVGADAGGGAHVRVFDRGVEKCNFFAYPGFTGGVRVAVGDVNGDGTSDIITAPGSGGGPHIRVFDGRTCNPLTSAIGSFMTFGGNFPGGVFVAAGDVNGDGLADVITTADAGGGPRVMVYSGLDGTVLHDFFAYGPGFLGGVRVAAGDVNGDGKADIITTPGAGGGPHVRVFSGADPTTVLHDFFAYDPSFTGGLYVTADDLNGDGRADMITGAGAGGGPHVRIFSGLNRADLGSFFAYHPSFTGGVRVGTADVNGDGRPDILTTPGPKGGPHVRAFDGMTAAELDGFFAYDPLFSQGVFIAGRRRSQ